VIMMSGMDEQDLDKCPECHEIPKYWILGNNAVGGLIWLYTEGYSVQERRGIIRISRLEEITKVDAIEFHINYVWCSGCFKPFKDTVLIRRIIKRAKKLEKEGRVEFY